MDQFHPLYLVGWKIHKAETLLLILLLADIWKAKLLNQNYNITGFYSKISFVKLIYIYKKNKIYK